MGPEQFKPLCRPDRTGPGFAGNCRTGETEEDFKLETSVLTCETATQAPLCTDTYKDGHTPTEGR